MSVHTAFDIDEPRTAQPSKLTIFVPMQISWEDYVRGVFDDNVGAILDGIIRAQLLADATRQTY